MIQEMGSIVEVVAHHEIHKDRVELLHKCAVRGGCTVHRSKLVDERGQISFDATMLPHVRFTSGKAMPSHHGRFKTEVIDATCRQTACLLCDDRPSGAFPCQRQQLVATLYQLLVPGIQFAKAGLKNLEPRNSHWSINRLRLQPQDVLVRRFHRTVTPGSRLDRANVACGAIRPRNGYCAAAWNSCSNFFCALPLCLTALASGRLTGSPTTTRPTMPMP